MRQAILHMEFACQIYERQLDAGRYFLHEHPLTATSWGLKCIKRIRSRAGVVTVRGDQCMMGLTTKGPNGEAARAMKPTRFMTNSECIAYQLEQKCDKQHEHQPLTQGRAEAAAQYPVEMCERIIDGMRQQITSDIEGLNEVINYIVDSTVDNGNNFEGLCSVKKGKYWDDVHGVELEEAKVLEAREKEMDYFRKMQVYVKTSMQECWNQTGKAPIMIRWVDTEKNCDPNNPNYRSRLVAMQFKVHGDRPDLYSPTPPLEALKVLLALAAAARHSEREWDGRISEGPVEIVHSDVSRAYFNAPISEPTYVRIPDED